MPPKKMLPMDRRTFIAASAAWLGCTATASAFWPFGSKTQSPAGEDIRGRVFRGEAPAQLWQWSRQAYRFKKMEGGRVVCEVCPHGCIMAPGDRSLCRSKVNIGGNLYTLAYGNPCAVHIDPIEKKPLYHFMPGIKAYSLAAAGCNFRCLNCQNWEISQFAPDQIEHQSLWPDQVVAQAQGADCKAVAFTYSEPVTFIEYMTDIAKPAKAAGLKNLWISNGYINPGPLGDLCGLMDGANVNLKAFSDDIYRALNGGRREPVLETFKTMHARGLHFELTHLVVPGYTDDVEMLRRMCRWILETLGPDHPMHLLRFFPQYKLDRLAATPVSTLSRFRQEAMALGLRYVYLGNVPGHEGNHTYCHGCGKLIIERQGYLMPQFHLKQGRCEFCKTVIPGVWA